MSAVWKEWALKKLDKIARSSLTRTLRPVVPARGSPVKVGVLCRAGFVDDVLADLCHQLYQESLVECLRRC
eukprot:760599-Hanusia_phi.AAC.2